MSKPGKAPVRRSSRLSGKNRTTEPTDSDIEERPKVKRQRSKKQKPPEHHHKIAEAEIVSEMPEEKVMGDVSEFNLPELNCPQEWSKLLVSSPKLRKLSNTSLNDVNSSLSGSDWEDVEVPSTSTEPVKVVVKSKPGKWEKLIRQEINRSLRERDEVLHMLSIAGYMMHLRFQMSCTVLVVERLRESDQLSKKFACELPDDLQAALKQFRGSLSSDEQGKHQSEKWNKENYCEQYAKTIDTMSYSNPLELTILFLSFFMACNCEVRICMGFKPLPEWPTIKGPKKRDVHLESKNVVEEWKYWMEYFDTNQKRWISVHPCNCVIDEPSKVEEKGAVNYVLAVDKYLKVKDVTARYASQFLSSAFRKTRAPNIKQIIGAKEFRPSKKDDMLEDSQIRKMLLSRPMPLTVSEFKNHPLYVLEKDLLKFEAIYPPDIQPLGTVRGHKIYPRGSVYTLQGELNWIRQARSVKKDEAPFKVVKARPKLSIPAEERVPLFLNVFGYWQTEPYCVPKVENGKIPRNEYGNVYMYQPSMLPEGCKHIQKRGVLQVAKTLGLQAVPAVVGWEFSGGRNHPLIDGCVVLAEDAQILSNACSELEKDRSVKQLKAAENRSMQLWRRFYKGVLLYDRMRRRVQIRGS